MFDFNEKVVNRVRKIAEIKQLLDNGQFKGVVDISLQSKKNVSMSTTRIINPKIRSAEVGAELIDQRNRAMIGYKNIDEITSRTYYDGSENYYIVYADGLVMSVTFKQQ